jgi:prefoldin subunit 5
MDTLTETLISAGPLGAIVVALGFGYWQQQRRFEARVRDAQAVTEQLLEFNERWMTAIAELTQAVSELRVVLQERHTGATSTPSRRRPE